MFKIHLNLNNEVKAINEIVTRNLSETLIFAYETKDNIGYYTVSFDLKNERYIIHWYCSGTGISCFYNEYKYYKFSFQQVKEFLNAIITANLNKWCNND